MGAFERVIKAFFRAFVVVLVVLAVTGGIVAYSISSKGLSTRTSPSMAEETIALTIRSLATPLAHFIRRLPNLTAADIERMESLNPQSPAKFREAEEARLFLEGMTEPPTNSTPARPHHD